MNLSVFIQTHTGILGLRVRTPTQTTLRNSLLASTSVYIIRPNICQSASLVFFMLLDPTVYKYIIAHTTNEFTKRSRIVRHTEDFRPNLKKVYIRERAQEISAGFAKRINSFTLSRFHENEAPTRPHKSPPNSSRQNDRNAPVQRCVYSYFWGSKCMHTSYIGT